jgi:transcriptional regulator GlxA family with amidase domain
LQAAKNLLETTFLSVKEIVALVGCNDESHFLRSFKTLYGLTPSEHRWEFSGSLGQQKKKPMQLHPTGRLANEQ